MLSYATASLSSFSTGINKTLLKIISVSMDATVEIRLIKWINPEHESKISNNMKEVKI